MRASRPTKQHENIYIYAKNARKIRAFFVFYIHDFDLFFSFAHV